MQFISPIFKLSTSLIEKPWKLVIAAYFVLCTLTLFSRFLVLRSEIATEINTAYTYHEGCIKTPELSGFPACKKAEIDGHRWAISSAIERLLIESPEIFKHDLNPILFVVSNYPIMISIAFLILKQIFDWNWNYIAMRRKKKKDDELRRCIMDNDRYTLGYSVPFSGENMFQRRTALLGERQELD